ncbi:MAG: DUF5103 domain-containing protein [Altibacter sp.]|uniref:type IX secretion system plug protein n=1 Tax=Altibacter sp. TaxID=2024823 RepID=UPI001DD1A6C8|nr:DUF5103 domain-containing protein [Altibacter sp.]MBZ0328077.1 DUF5103 domain-containing protein [Altibacter sp.]
MYRKTVAFYFLFCLTFSVYSQVEERVAPSYISTIQFSGTTAQSQLPIIRLGESLNLTFDALNGEEEDFYYTITHYNFDWTPSDLSKGEYLDGFDEMRIQTYENSLNTLQLFSHYILRIPNRDTRKIEKSGNYLLSIYNDDNALIFSRKFMVVESDVTVGVEIKRSRDLNYIEEKQVVQFVINSPRLLLINPKQTVKTVVLQNSNLKTAITNLKPQYTIGTELIYRYDKEAAFWGGNEFLSFDNKDIRSATYGIRRVELNDIYENFLYTNISRKDRPYTYNPDVNGNFVVRNIDAERQSIESDYVRIHFNLQYFEDIGDKEIHIYGNFNNWTIDGTTFLEYDSTSDTYRTSRLFKQGYYDYKYVLVDRDGSVDEGAIDGNFWQTENQYTVLVYYRDLGGRYDRIVGMGTGSSSKITNN